MIHFRVIPTANGDTNKFLLDFKTKMSICKLYLQYQSNYQYEVRTNN